MYALRQGGIFDKLYIRCIDTWADFERYAKWGRGAPKGDRIRVEYSKTALDDELEVLDSEWMGGSTENKESDSEGDSTDDQESEGMGMGMGGSMDE